MGKPRFRLYLAVSVDGFIADEEGGVDFLDGFDPAALGFGEFIQGVSLLVMGSRTYEQCLGFHEWPYGRIPTIVMTRRDLPRPAGAVVRFHRASAAELLEELNQHGGDIWIVGGGKMIAALLNAGVRPSLELTVIPRVLGRGVRLFDEHDWRGRLSLIHAKEHADGVLTLHYKPLDVA
jgi:dihydrofolate reductase